MHKFFSIVVAFCLLASCNNSSNDASNTKDSSSNDASPKTTTMLPDRKNFQQTIEGKQTDLYVLKNKNGMTAAITNYGGRLVSLLVPDKNGKLTDVVVGLGSVTDYISSTEPYFGATIGRVGNRIAKGKFSIDGKQHTLFTNNGPNTLHGGKKGYQAVIWDASQPNDTTLELHYLSKDGEEGFPGN